MQLWRRAHLLAKKGISSNTDGFVHVEIVKMNFNPLFQFFSISKLYKKKHIYTSGVGNVNSCENRLNTDRKKSPANTVKFPNLISLYNIEWEVDKCETRNKLCSFPSLKLKTLTFFSKLYPSILPVCIV